MATATHAGAVYYGKELKGIARATGMPIGLLAILQLVYEASACCTSVVVDDPESGRPVHIRTMDWEMEWLAPLTIEVEFVRGGNTLFVAPTWAGAVGVLTACKPGVFSASVNFRLTEDGSYWTNVKKLLTRSWPIGFLLREVLESATSFEEARDVLATAPLVAPVYFTLCGMESGEGVVLTRNPGDELPRWALELNGPCVQTNVDWFDEDGDSDIMWSRERQALGRVLVGSLEDVEVETLMRMMSTFPIFNELTIYAAYMNPTTGVVKTYIPDPDTGFVAHADAPAVGPASRVRCTLCRTRVTPELNPSGRCAHVGDWHAAYSDCSKLKCGWGLKSSIGKQHWSCCFSTDRRNAGCPKSGPHVLSEDGDVSGDDSSDDEEYSSS